MTNITRTLKSGKTLEITCEGTLLTATVDGEKISSGGLSKMPAAMVSKAVGYAMIACGNVPVTAEEAKKLQRWIDEGKRAINKKIVAAERYNNLMNEGGEGYTPHAF